LRILKSILIFGVLLFANSQMYAQIKIDLTKNLSDTAGKKKDSTSFKKDSTKLSSVIGANNADLLKDTTVYTFTNDLRFPIQDKRGDFLSQASNNPYDLRDTSIVKRKVEYDAASKRYYLTDMIGSGYQRTPSTLNFDEFWKLKTAKDEQAYFRQRANSIGVLNRKITRPKSKVFDSYFDRLFGKTGSDLKVDIKPVGEINIKAGYQGQNVKNPTLPERARRNGGFDFDANTNFSMNASIGDKLKFPINLNSLSNLGFDFDKKIIKIMGGSVKRLGTYVASLRLHRNVIHELSFEVIKAVD
jgi:hypothetical protein